MKPEIFQRLLIEEEKSKGNMRTPADLWGRLPSGADFMDTAIIGGTSVADIVAGKIQESQIPEDVKTAFHLQFPSLHEGFVHAVQRLSQNGTALAGLVIGVKGKLFEVEYVDWLNHGHLPAGCVAELAHAANNPAWDISIYDSAGHVMQNLQLKASDSLAYVKHALELHPNIDVVVPHDVFQHVANHPELLGHVLDGGHPLAVLNSTVSDAAHNAEAADIHFHFPLIGIAYIVGSTLWRYRRGAMSLESALSSAVERSLLSIVSTAVAWGSGAVMHEPLVGLPVGIATRLLWGRWLGKKKLRNVLDHRIEIVSDASMSLSSVVRRPIFLLSPT